MRQLKATAWMHNRCRMVVASFLAKDLFVDWRLGEAYFMLNLIDGDLASNTGGWGFSTSLGADAQPVFQTFNPTRQSERFDPHGAYIRRWVPELRDIPAGAGGIHDPYSTAATARVARKNGYPRPLVDHRESLARMKERYSAAKA